MAAVLETAPPATHPQLARPRQAEVGVKCYDFDSLYESASFVSLQEVKK